jgi:hypothetical protein
MLRSHGEHGATFFLREGFSLAPTGIRDRHDVVFRQLVQDLPHDFRGQCCKTLVPVVRVGPISHI